MDIPLTWGKVARIDHEIEAARAYDAAIALVAAEFAPFNFPTAA